MRSICRPAVIFKLAVAASLLGSAVYAQSQKPQAKPQPKPAPEITRNQLLDVPLQGLKGLEGVMYVTDIPPGLSAARHSHPGYEFNYILKGAVTFQPDGEKPFTLKAGQGMYNMRDHIHKVWNASATEPAQLVAVLIKDQGKPLAVPVK